MGESGGKYETGTYRSVHVQPVWRTLVRRSKLSRATYSANLSDLYVFSDGAKSEIDQSEVDAVRQYLRSIRGSIPFTSRNSLTTSGSHSRLFEVCRKCVKNRDA